MRLLASRPRGAKELERSLSERGYSGAAIAGAFARLSEHGYVDDVAAARSAARLRGERYGRARVERELKERGFARDTIAAALEAEGGRLREDEALRRAFQRLWKARANLAPALRRRRVFDALTRRGFPADRISEIIRSWYEIDGS